MALIDKASLLFVPSVVAEGKAFNILPSGNRAPDSTDQNSGYDQTRADFDFDRGSNAAATRIGSDGLIKKYRENLLLQSNQFDTTWIKSNASVTSGHSGYDGSSDAWKLIQNTTNTYHFIYQNVSVSSICTLSIYAKAGEYSGISFFFPNLGGTSTATTFNLSTGAFVNNTHNATAQDVGGGWYRISLLSKPSGTQNFNIYANQTTQQSEAGDGTSGIYIQDAQLESGLVATDYLDSTSVTGKAGVLVDLPRINYDANGENGALLLEPSRQNLVAYSEYITGFSTSNTGVSIEENATTSPEGVVNAAKIKEDATNAAHALRQLTGPTLTSGTDYTFSFFAKKGERSIVALSNTIGASNDANCFFDLENGQVLTNQFNSASIEDFGNGWYRCIATDTADAADDYDTRIYTATADNQFSHQGVSGSGLYIYGIQLEAGNYVSSYIPTMGTSETRAADSCSVTGVSDVIGQTEGTLYFEGSVKSDGANVVFFEIVNGTDSSNTMTLYINNSNNNLEMYNPDAGPNVNILKDGNNQGVDFKLALAYQSNDYVCYVNGVQTYIDNSANVPISMNGVYIGQNRNGVEKGLTIAKQAVLFKERLSNAELAALTA